MPDFDVIVLGGGTAGTHVATEVAKASRPAAIIEAGLVGGESPYLACMPSKSLLQSARRGETWEHAIARRDEITGHLDDAAAAARLAAAGVTLIRGTGRASNQVSSKSSAPVSPPDRAAAAVTSAAVTSAAAVTSPISATATWWSLPAVSLSLPCLMAWPTSPRGRVRRH